MSQRTICDCGCGRQLVGPDAGDAPPVVRTIAGLEVELHVRQPDGERLNIRPSCAQVAAATGELLEAPAAGTVSIRKRRAS